MTPLVPASFPLALLFLLAWVGVPLRMTHPVPRHRARLACRRRLPGH